MKQTKGQARKSITVGELLEMIKLVDIEKETFSDGSVSSGRYTIHIDVIPARRKPARRKPRDAIAEEIILDDGKGEKMPEAKREIKSLIFRKYDSEAACAESLGWSRQRLNKIVNGKKRTFCFRSSKYCEGLRCKRGHNMQYFFTHARNREVGRK